MAKSNAQAALPPEAPPASADPPSAPPSSGAEQLVAQLRDELASLEKLATEEAARAAAEIQRLGAELDAAAKGRDELASRLADARDIIARQHGELEQLARRAEAELAAAKQEPEPPTPPPPPPGRHVRALGSLVLAIDGSRREIRPGEELTLTVGDLEQLPQDSFEEI
jgi:hypothetical protein